MPGSNQDPLFLRDSSVNENSFVSRNRVTTGSPKALGEARVAFLRDEGIAAKERLERPENIAAAAAHAQKKNAHGRPPNSRSLLNRHCTITQRPCVVRRSGTKRSSFSTCSTRPTSYSTFDR